MDFFLSPLVVIITELSNGEMKEMADRFDSLFSEI